MKAANYLNIFLIIVLAFAGVSAQEVPQFIHYQGNLASANGNPVNDNLLMVFKIFDVASGGTALWEELHSSVPVEDGLFSVQLGSKPTSPFPSDLFSGERYLEIQIGNEILQPRQKIGSVAFAFKASEATPTGSAGGDLSGIYPNPGIANDAVTTSKIASSAVTSGKIASNAINSSSMIASGTIQGSDIASNSITTENLAENAATKAYEISGSGTISLASVDWVNFVDPNNPSNLTISTTGGPLLLAFYAVVAGASSASTDNWFRLMLNNAVIPNTEVVGNTDGEGFPQTVALTRVIPMPPGQNTFSIQYRTFLGRPGRVFTWGLTAVELKR